MKFCKNSGEFQKPSYTNFVQKDQNMHIHIGTKNIDTIAPGVIVGAHRAECGTNGRMSDKTMSSMDSLLERLLDTEVLKAVSQNRWAMDDNQME